jgi:hypothetical protein
MEPECIPEQLMDCAPGAVVSGGTRRHLRRYARTPFEIFKIGKEIFQLRNQGEILG